MRLIDADKLHYHRELIDKLDRGIGSAVVVYAKEIDKAPLVDAIPIEWLKKKSQEFAERYWSKKDDHKKLILRMADCPIVIQQMIKEWKVENDTQI